MWRLVAVCVLAVWGCYSTVRTRLPISLDGATACAERCRDRWNQGECLAKCPGAIQDEGSCEKTDYELCIEHQEVDNGMTLLALILPIVIVGGLIALARANPLYGE